jgi:hypothetical protein
MDISDDRYWYKAVCIPVIAGIGFIGNTAMIVKCVKMVSIITLKNNAKY